MIDEPFNRLELAEAESLTLIAEEAGEIVQAVGKILRHGLYTHDPADDSGNDNSDDLEKEIGDLLAAVDIAIFNIGSTVISRRAIETARRRKLKSISKYLHHAKVPK
jgi:NTP pyrophosphatase (non-canonical NTP hydrolase)